MSDCITVSSWDEALPYLLKGYVLTTIARTYSHGRETGCSMSFVKMDMEEIVRVRQLNTALQAQIAEITKHNEAFAEEWDKCKAELGFEHTGPLHVAIHKLRLIKEGWEERAKESEKQRDQAHAINDSTVIGLSHLLRRYGLKIKLRHSGYVDAISDHIQHLHDSVAGQQKRADKLQANYSTVQEELGSLQTKLVCANMQLSQVKAERDALKRALAERDTVKYQGQTPIHTVKAHRRSCPDWTALDAGWCTMQWNNHDKRDYGPRPSPGTDKCNCGVRRNARPIDPNPPKYCYIDVRFLDQPVGVSKAFCDMWLEIGAMLAAEQFAARLMREQLGYGKPAFTTPDDVCKAFPDLFRSCPKCGQMHFAQSDAWCSYCVSRKAPSLRTCSQCSKRFWSNSNLIFEHCFRCKRQEWANTFADAWRDIATAYWWQQFAKVWGKIGIAKANSVQPSGPWCQFCNKHSPEGHLLSNGWVMCSSCTKKWV